MTQEQGLVDPGITTMEASCRYSQHLGGRGRRFSMSSVSDRATQGGPILNQKQSKAKPKEQQQQNMDIDKNSLNRTPLA